MTQECSFELLLTVSMIQHRVPRRTNPTKGRKVPHELGLNSVLFLFQPVLLEPVVQVCFGGFVALRDEALRRSVRQQAFDLRAVRIKLTFAHAFWSPQLHPLRLPVAQRFLCPLRNQIALNLRRHGKRHRNNFALNTLIQSPIAFDGINVDTSLRGERENLHTLQHTAAQP